MPDAPLPPPTHRHGGDEEWDKGRTVGRRSTATSAIGWSSRIDQQGIEGKAGDDLGGAKDQALRQNRPGDYAAMAVAVLGVCIPTFVTAPLPYENLTTISDAEAL